MRSHFPMNKFVASVCLLLISLGAATGAHAQLMNKESIDRIVAVAEDEVILQSDLDAAVNNVMNQYRSNPQQLPPHDVLEKQVLDSLIMLRLQVQRAQSTGIRVSDADVDQAMQRVAENNHISVQQLRASLSQQGMDIDTFRKSVRDQLLVQRLQQRVVQSQSQVSDSEIDILLASNSLKEGEVHLQHILINLPDGANAQQIQEAKDKADDVKKQLDGGMDFTAAAIRFSGAPDALQGGDLGWRHYDEVPEAFANLVEGMQPGTVSQVVRGPSGFHIVKLVERRSNSKQVVTEYHARHVLIKTGELASDEDAQKTVADIRRRVVDNKEDFGALAKKVFAGSDQRAGRWRSRLVPARPVRPDRERAAHLAQGRRSLAAVPDRRRLGHHPAPRHARGRRHRYRQARTRARRDPQSQSRRGIRKLPAPGAQRIVRRQPPDRHRFRRQQRRRQRPVKRHERGETVAAAHRHHGGRTGRHRT